MGMLSRFRRFARASGGLAAVEFALIAPMMVFLLFGSVELLDALSANRRTQNVAASVADVVARDTEISNSELTGIWSAMDVLMIPDTAEFMDVRITSISIESASVARVVWSEARNNYSRLSPGSTVALPSAMMLPGSSLIMTETRFNYQPPLSFLFSGGVPMEHKAYRRSRLVDPIPRVS
ncbi:MAG: TadE/TadG family type IV pilus assembly protein [Hyphomonadaceae bacterium]